MTRARRVAHAAGFTLVEIMVTLAIIGIISSVTAANVIRDMPRHRLTNAASQLAWTFRALRMQAISKNRDVTVTFTSNHVYTIDSGEVKTVDLNVAYPGVQLASTANPVFKSTGTVTNTPTITLTNPTGSKTLTMNILGDITIQ